MEDILTRYNVMDVSELEILILDEADVLLFGKTIMDPTISAILNKLPKMRRTGIFSATTTFTNKSCAHGASASKRKKVKLANLWRFSYVLVRRIDSSFTTITLR